LGLAYGAMSQGQQKGRPSTSGLPGSVVFAARVDGGQDPAWSAETRQTPARKREDRLGRLSPTPPPEGRHRGFLFRRAGPAHGDVS